MFIPFTFTRNCLRKKIKSAENLNPPESPGLAPSRPVYPSSTRPQVLGRGLFVWSVSTSLGHRVITPVQREV